MLTLVIVVILINCVFGANILYIAPVASPSHHIWNRALAFALLEKGHNVTMLGHDEEKGPLPKNFTLILLEGIYKEEGVGLDMEMLKAQTPLTSVVGMYKWAVYTCEYDTKTEGLQQLLHYPQDFKFDLIIFDISLGQCLYPLLEIFKDPPAVAVTPFLLPPVLSKSFGNHLYTSYMPFYNSDFSDKMNFKERVLNFIYVYFELLYRNYVYLSEATTVARRKFGESVRSLEETERRMSILLCNMDTVLDYPIALSPNIIAVGGLHVKPPKVLPLDLQKALDNAKHGVILFSLGSNLRSDKLDVNTRQAFLDAFSKVPHTILWKFEDETVQNLPKNVIVRKWLPQNDILGHKNLKLFISHGGALSTQEAMYHGVPVLGIPIFSDQKVNIAKMVQRRLAVHVDIQNITSNIMYEKLTEMLFNPVYGNNVKKISDYYRDQPQTALQKGVFWTEYVLRYGSAEHLVTVARDMPSYQLDNLDIFGVFLLSSVVFYYFVILLLCRFISKFQRSQKTKSD